MADIVELHAKDVMTVEEALATVGRLAPREILVLGYDEEGHFFAISSSINLRDALWLVSLEQQNLMDAAKATEDDGD